MYISQIAVFTYSTKLQIMKKIEAANYLQW